LHNVEEFSVAVVAVGPFVELGVDEQSESIELLIFEASDIVARVLEVFLPEYIQFIALEVASLDEHDIEVDLGEVYLQLECEAVTDETLAIALHEAYGDHIVVDLAPHFFGEVEVEVEGLRLEVITEDVGVVLVDEYFAKDGFVLDLLLVLDLGLEGADLEELLLGEIDEETDALHRDRVTHAEQVGPRSVAHQFLFVGLEEDGGEGLVAEDHVVAEHGVAGVVGQCAWARVHEDHAEPVLLEAVDAAHVYCVLVVAEVTGGLEPGLGGAQPGVLVSCELHEGESTGNFGWGLGHRGCVGLS
jgi:hypothetical protein